MFAQLLQMLLQLPQHQRRRSNGRLAGGLARLLCLLWLAGVAMRMTLLVMRMATPAEKAKQSSKTAGQAAFAATS